MSLLPPRLLQRLTRSRLRPRRARASTGVGERRSQAKGTGAEFADYRPYEPGDDIRHLDPHVFARLGEHHIRQFSLEQGLPVTVLLDASASMRFGQPQKFAFAQSVAAALAYVALAGGDRVQVGTFAGDRVAWFAPLHGVQRAPTLFSWLERQAPRGATDLPRVAQLARSRLRQDGLLIVVSDWLTPDLEPNPAADSVSGLNDLERALRTFAQARQELVAVQVLAPEEEEPERLGAGGLRLLDAETGREVELALDAAIIARYREEFEGWSRGVQHAVRAHQGLFLRVRSDADLERLLTRDLRNAGLLA